jgi:hypothetical protein
MKNKNNGSNQIDLFTPLAEIFHEFCMLLFNLCKMVGIWGFKKWFNIHPDLQKIEHKSLKVKATTEIEDALGIDTKSRRILPLYEIDYRKHSFIVGASGFGKTNLISILQEHSLRKSKPIIFFDPKGDAEAMKTFKAICDKYKKPCYMFSENLKDSIKLNPILEGSINQVTDRIMCSFNWSEQYYKDAARRSLTKALQKLESNSQPFSLRNVYNELLKIETKENIGLISKIEAILTSDFGKILNAEFDGLTLSKIREEKACLYIGLSTQGYGETAKAIGKLFLGELLHNSYKTLGDGQKADNGLNNPISIYFDEFGSIITNEFIELQNKCRGAGIEITMAVQTAADIDKISPELTKQVIENAGNLFILKQRLDASASLFAEAVGTVVTKKHTFVIEDGLVQSKGSIREANELLVHPDIIKNLNIGQCILLRQGPTRVNLVNIRNRKFDLVEKLNKPKNNYPDIA